MKHNTQPAGNLVQTSRILHSQAAGPTLASTSASRPRSLTMHILCAFPIHRHQAPLGTLRSFQLRPSPRHGFRIDPKTPRLHTSLDPPWPRPPPPGPRSLPAQPPSPASATPLPAERILAPDHLRNLRGQLGNAGGQLGHLCEWWHTQQHRQRERQRESNYAWPRKVPSQQIDIGDTFAQGDTSSTAL